MFSCMGWSWFGPEQHVACSMGICSQNGPFHIVAATPMADGEFWKGLTKPQSLPLQGKLWREGTKPRP